MTKANSLTLPEKRKLAALETTIQRGLKYYIEVGEALLTIRNERLYRRDYGTFEDYCAQRWHMKRQRAYQMMDAAEVTGNLSQIFDKPVRESHAAELSALPPEQQTEAWGKVLETTAVQDVTAAHVREVVETLSAPNYKRDAKTMRTADENVPKPYDACQTPPHALDPLLPYLNPDWTIWECAAGERLLVEGLYDSGFQSITASDILSGENFFEYTPSFWDCIVTNPPFSLKFRWLERCYALGKPFALLLPVEVLGASTAQALFSTYGVEVILMDKRINFKMPNKGWDGGGAQFPVAWFTYGLNIGQQLTFARLQVGTDG